MTNPPIKANPVVFRRLGLVTVVAVYLVILAGGIVRSTGSGMGCPDWPKCFGSWVPPTEVAQLPATYKEDFTAKRKVKNAKLADYLRRAGLADLSVLVRNDFGKEEPSFNPVKTWIEYVNRLLGVLVGVLIFLTLAFSTRFFNQNRPVFWASLAAFVLVGVQGWLGSVVVSTNLLPGMITVHMLLAIVIVGLLLYAVLRSYGASFQAEMSKNTPQISRWLVVAMALLLAQVLLGTQVRQAVDHAAHLLGQAARGSWVASLGVNFLVHRSFSLVVMAVHVYLILLLRRNLSARGWLYNYTLGLTAVVGLEIASGAAMAYLAIPALLQPIHLFLAVVALGLQFVLLTQLNRPVKKMTATLAPMAN